MTLRVLGLIGLVVCGLAGCRQPISLPVWSEIDELPLVPADSAHADWLRLWRAWPAPQLSFIGEHAEGWRYATGDPAEGLVVGFDRRPAMDTLVNLPHRIPLPDTPMWYERKVEADSAAGLHINADDGAQVFQDGWPVFQTLVNQMAGRPGAFSIGLGDLVSNGAEEEGWLSFVMALQPLLRAMPVFPVAGNHDYDRFYYDLIPRLYLENTRSEGLGPAYFSWTHAGAFFMAVDPNSSFPLGFDPKQQAWIDASMVSDAWREANWRFILLHQAPYSQGWPGYHGDAFIRELVDARAESHRIDFVLTGHTHNYERLKKTYGGQETHFVVLGGAGGGLEPPASSDYPVMDRVIKQHHFAVFSVTPGVVEVDVIGLDGAGLDRWSTR